MITQEYLKELFHYCPDSGLFTRKTSRGGMFAGSIAGHLKTDGYIRIKVDRISYLAHRLSWLYVTGSFPDYQIDHDNRFANLRSVGHGENNRNHTISIKTNQELLGFVGTSEINDGSQGFALMATSCTSDTLSIKKLLFQQES